jgi:2-alkyl-3-oxoalkanoate reductase
MRIGVVGASGFIGHRILEVFYERGVEVRPIIRSSANIDRLKINHLDTRVANAFDRISLASAFKGCDVIIHSILGSPGLIRGSIIPTYQAAQSVGVRRIIYLSSMIVHTSAPVSGTTESSPLIEHQPFPTHNAKIYAERKLLQLRENGSVEVTIFRPGIVFGPKSRWVSELANQLALGKAYLINEGKGICNTVYIDNLVHAIYLALTIDKADKEAFFVGDCEQITWFNFYRSFAEALGIDMTQISQITGSKFNQSWKEQPLSSIWNSEIIQRTLSFLPNKLKQDVRYIFWQLRKPLSSETNHAESTQSQPVMSEMMTILQQSEYKLPFAKAQRILGYEPIVSFSEGCQQSIDWLLEHNSSFKNFRSAIEFLPEIN